MKTISTISNGIAWPKGRKQDVALNLLSEWAESRHRRTRHCVILLTSAVSLILITIITIPHLDRVRTSAGNHLSQDKSQLALVQQALDRSNTLQLAGNKVNKANEFGDSLSGNFRRFLGETYQVLNSAGPGIALSSIHTEAKDGHVSIRCSGDASEYSVLAGFADRASGKPVQGSVVGTRPNALFAKEGVSFDFVKQVPL